MLSKSKNKNILIIFTLFIFGLLIYFNSFTNKFVYDDYLLIIDNPAIKSFGNVFDIFKHDLYYYVSSSNFYRPILSLSFMVDYFFWKLNPLGYHITNTLLHIANAILLFFLLKLIIKNENVSFITSAFFLCHPAQTQAVTYISGRADLLAMFFTLSYFLIYFKSLKVRKFLFLSYFLFCLSILTKETYMITPFLLFLCINIFFKEKYSGFRKDFLVFLGIILVYAFLRVTLFRSFLVPQIVMPYSARLRLLNLPSIISEFFYILIFPIGLHIDRHFSLLKGVLQPRIFLSIFLLILIIVLLVKYHKKKKVVFFAGMWFFISLLPVSNIVIALNAIIAEHWLYLPGIGFFIIVSLIIDSMNRHSKVLRNASFILFFTLIFLGSAMTIERNKVWRNEVSLYTDALGYLESNQGGRLHYNLGCAYMDLRLYDAAISEYEKAMRLLPSVKQLLCYHNLAKAYHYKGDKQKALSLWKKALTIKPSNINEENIIKQIKEILEKEYQLKIQP